MALPKPFDRVVHQTNHWCAQATCAVSTVLFSIFCAQPILADVKLHPLAHEMAFAYTDTLHPSGLIPSWDRDIHLQMLAPDTNQNIYYAAPLIFSTIFRYGELALTRVAFETGEFSILDRSNKVRPATNFLVVFYDGPDEDFGKNADYNLMTQDPGSRKFSESLQPRYQRVRDGCFVGVTADEQNRVLRVLFLINGEKPVEDQVKCAKIVLPSVFGVAATHIPIERFSDGDDEAFTAFDDINIQMKIKAATACRLYDKDRTTACTDKALHFDYQQMGALSGEK